MRSQREQRGQRCQRSRAHRGPTCAWIGPYLCTVVGGEAAPGGGEGSDAELVDVMWLRLREEHAWLDDIRADVFLYPQVQALRTLLASREPDVRSLCHNTR